MAQLLPITPKNSFNLIFFILYYLIFFMFQMYDELATLPDFANLFMLDLTQHFHYNCDI